MTSGRNWDRQRDRNRVARQGSETLDGLGVLHGAPKAQKTPRQLRAELAAAPLARGATITRAVTCKCGRTVRVKLPIAKAGARLRCSRCGEVAK